MYNNKKERNMIKLKNVSKYYYNKGIIASGFIKVSLKVVDLNARRKEQPDHR